MPEREFDQLAQARRLTQNLQPFSLVSFSQEEEEEETKVDPALDFSVALDDGFT